jgi:hypothetical protein
MDRQAPSLFSSPIINHESSSSHPSIIIQFNCAASIIVVMAVPMQKPYRFLLLVVFASTSLFCHGYVLQNPITQHHSRRCGDLSRRQQQQQQSSCRTATVVTTTSTETKEGPSSSFTDTLLDRLRRNDTSPITVEGYVTSKRSLGKQLVFVDFQTAAIDNDNDDGLCQAMLRQEYFLGSHYAGYRRCLLKGTKLRLSGVASPTRNPGNVVLLIQSIQLLELPRQVQHIQIILQQGKEGTIPMEQVRTACHRPELLLDHPHPHPPAAGEDTTTTTTTTIRSEKQWFKDLAKDILASLPEDPNYPKAVDQKELSRNGNFVVPKAPNEWQTVPKALFLPTATNQDIPKMEEEEPLQQNEEYFNKAATAAEAAVVVSYSGWVQNRRRFDGDIAMISLVDNLTLLSEDTSDVLNVATDRLACLVHPEYCLVPEGAASLYRNLMAVGAKVSVQGRMIHSEHLGKSILWVQKMRLVQSSSQSVTILHLLDLLYEQKIGMEEVAEALLLSSDPEAQKQLLLSLNDATERQWKANQLAVHLSNNNTHVKPELLEVMEKYRYISKRHPVLPTEIIPAEEDEDSDDKTNPNNKKKNTLMMMPAIGMPGTKWQSKKRPQLEWMGQQIRSVLKSHKDYGKRKLLILDIGGGKGSLANYLGRAITDVQIHVVDICEGAVANGELKAKKLNVPVEFQIADASSSSALKEVQADVVVALHACGHLSDVALAHAIQRRAGFVIVPCCFNSNPHLRIPSSSSSSPVRETVPDWLGVPPEDWSALKLLAEVQGDIPLASEAIGILCAVRAEAARKKMISEDENMEEPDIKIRSFPIQYSTRNTVLVGLCS